MRRSLPFLLSLLLVSSLQAEDPPKLVVHEWGTFTSVSGSDGVALEWRPLSGPSDLPGFVHGAGGNIHGSRSYEAGDCTCPECIRTNHADCRCCKKCMKGTVRMETPVIYFYADRECEAYVQVGFPKGRITEWYPWAQEASPGRGIDWGRFKILPGAKADLPTEKGDDHYYAARETDSALLRVCGSNGRSETEKFLFYRGVGTFALPLSATLQEDTLILHNVQTGHKLSDIHYLAFFGDAKGGSRGWCGQVAGETQAGMKVSPGVWKNGKLGVPAKEFKEDLRRMLVAAGLYEKEAVAMIETWKDSWFGPGLRVFYILPREEVDRILPLTIAPTPGELKRVMVARLEILTPELEKEILDLVDAGRIEEAVKKHGRFAEPVLKLLLAKEKDAGRRKEMERFLANGRGER